MHYSSSLAIPATPVSAATVAVPRTGAPPRTIIKRLVQGSLAPDRDFSRLQRHAPDPKDQSQSFTHGHLLEGMNAKGILRFIFLMGKTKRGFRIRTAVRTAGLEKATFPKGAP